jgi:chain length determinant protein EpsF
MTFSHFLSMIRARWLTATVLMLLVVTAVTVVTLLMPKEYTATASVLVDGRAAAVDPLAGVVLPGVVSTGFITTQADLIKSERVIRRALRSLGLHNNAELRESWMKESKGVGDFEAWEAELLGKRLEVKPSRESSIIALTYSAQDSNFAAAMTNAIVQAYVDTTLEMRVEPAKQYRAFFEVRAKQLREALEEAQKKLLTYQTSNGILPTDDRLDVESARLADLNVQLVAMQTLAAESSSRQSQSVGKADRIQEVIGNPVISALTSDLARQEALFEETSQRYGSEFPKVQELAANIAKLKSKIDSETRKVSSGLGVSSDINRSRVSQLNAALNEQRKKILDLKVKRDGASILVKDVESAQRALDAVQSRMSQTELESQNTQTSVSIVKQASASSSPSSPSVVRNIVVALFMGLVLGVAAAFTREMTDPRMRSEHDVLVGLKQPMLGILPKSAPKSSKGVAHQRLLRAPSPAIARLTQESN